MREEVYINTVAVKKKKMENTGDARFLYAGNGGGEVFSSGMNRVAHYADQSVGVGEFDSRYARLQWDIKNDARRSCLELGGYRIQ